MYRFRMPDGEAICTGVVPVRCGGTSQCIEFLPGPTSSPVLHDRPANRFDTQTLLRRDRGAESTGSRFQSPMKRKSDVPAACILIPGSSSISPRTDSSRADPTGCDSSSALNDTFKTTPLTAEVRPHRFGSPRAGASRRCPMNVGGFEQGSGMSWERIKNNHPPGSLAGGTSAEVGVESWCPNPSFPRCTDERRVRVVKANPIVLGDENREATKKKGNRQPMKGKPNRASVVSQEADSSLTHHESLRGNLSKASDAFKCCFPFYFLLSRNLRL